MLGKTRGCGRIYTVNLRTNVRPSAHIRPRTGSRYQSAESARIMESRHSGRAVSAVQPLKAAWTRRRLPLLSGGLSTTPQGDAPVLEGARDIVGQEGRSRRPVKRKVSLRLAERPSSRTQLRLDIVSGAPSGPSQVAKPGCLVWLAINVQL